MDINFQLPLEIHMKADPGSDILNTIPLLNLWWVVIPWE